jgi:hypothetical protein
MVQVLFDKQKTRYRDKPKRPQQCYGKQIQLLLYGNQRRCATGIETLSTVVLPYINNIPLNIHGANLVMFADDINVLITGSDVCAL